MPADTRRRVDAHPQSGHTYSGSTALREVAVNVSPTTPVAIDAKRAEPSPGGCLGGTPGCDCGPRSTSYLEPRYVTMVSTHSRAAAPASITPALELLLGIFPDGKGELPSCHTKSIRGNPCMTSRFVDKGTEADRGMTSSDVMELGTKCWRAQTSQSGNISASTGARAVSSI